MKLIFAAIFVALKSLVHVSAAERALRSFGRSQQQNPCILVQYEVEFTNGSSSSNWKCELSLADAKISGSHFVDIDGLGDNELNNTSSGTTSLFVTGGIIASGQLTIPTGAEKSLGSVGKRGPAENQNKQQRSFSLTAADKHSIMVVRVVAADSSPGSSTTQMKNFVFGSAGDVSNLRERYKSCSYGELLMEPFNGTTTTGIIVSNGVYQVSITNNAKGQEVDLIVNAAVSRLTALLGNLASQFDHVMLCLPPGTVMNGDRTWISWGFYNNYLTYFNNDWCNYPSSQVHEIGHNLNLRHSNEGSIEYGDTTCMMGWSYSKDTHRMCFNPAKSSQLGWYSLRTTTVDFTRRGSFRGNLIGVTDYTHPSSPGRFVYVKILGAPYGSSIDAYVGFNLATGINADVGEAKNMVTVYSMQAASGTAAYPSNLVAKIAAGQQSTVPNFAGSAGLVIKVNYMDLTSSLRVANVDIFLAG